MEIFIQSKKVVRHKYVLNRLFVWLVPYRDATHKQNTEAYKEKTRKCCELLSN